MFATAILAVVMSSPAFAHGENPKHGGVVKEASEISFELVKRDGKAVLYVEGHGKVVPTAGVSGKLTLLNGAGKTEPALVPAGENMLATTGQVKLDKGTKAVAAVIFADQKTVTVRFVMK